MQISFDLVQASDPDVYAALQGEEQRQRDGIELIPSENYAFPEVYATNGSVFANKYSEGYPGRRYYGGQQFTDRIETARGRAREGAVPRRARQRAAAERLADEPGRVHGVPRTRRHDPRDGSVARRSPDARRAGLVHGQDLQLRALSHAAAARRHRLRRRARDGEESEAEDRAVRTLVVSARVRLRALPLDRRRGRRIDDGRRLARRRTDRRRRARESARCRLRHRHDDDAQVAARSARRHDPLQVEARAEDRPGRVPGHARRSAHERGRRHRGDA